MRIGFYAEYTEDTAQFAHEVGFKSLQLSAWQNSSLDADNITSKSIESGRRSYRHSFFPHTLTLRGSA
ncbi:hypothetical protein P3T31_000821 [Rhizobium sp. AN70]|nr:hypothetical protein [Rhizobium sp. AN70]